MAARQSFQQLRDRLSRPAQLEAAALTDSMERELSLGELRLARAITQEQLAADLHVGQASIAKLERRTDMYLSTLRRFVEAMGGELDIVVRFPDQQQVGCVALESWPKPPCTRPAPSEVPGPPGGHQSAHDDRDFFGLCRGASSPRVAAVQSD